LFSCIGALICAVQLANQSKVSDIYYASVFFPKLAAPSVRFKNSKNTMKVKAHLHYGKNSFMVVGFKEQKKFA